MTGLLDTYFGYAQPLFGVLGAMLGLIVISSVAAVGVVLAAGLALKYFGRSFPVIAERALIVSRKMSKLLSLALAAFLVGAIAVEIWEAVATGKLTVYRHGIMHVYFWSEDPTGLIIELGSFALECTAFWVVIAYLLRKAASSGKPASPPTPPPRTAPR